ncbi:MAG: DUF2130 domain-containing protein [Endomicrobiales bacterium]|nr:DUF2130 domain-containing protein [Endomicrobiales bacterium]
MEISIKTKFEKEYESKLVDERKQLLDKAKKEAVDSVKVELSDLKEQVAEKSKKLEESQKQELDLRKRERMLAEKEELAKKEYEDKEKQLQAKFLTERKQIEDKVKKEVESSQSVLLADLKEQLDEKNKVLESAQQLELELRKQQRKLEDDKKSFELEMVRKLDGERKAIAEKISNDIADEHRLKDAEKDKQMTDMLKQIEDLKRKAEQGSQQAQGEVLELEIEHILKENFPFDEIIPVSKGVKGGDVIHTVKTQSGRVCGKILWETKRTKVWSDGWIIKLKDDQREAKADLSVIVSEILPKGLHHFRQIDDVWVTDIPSTLSLAFALRVVLTQVAKTQEVQTGKEEKKEIVYNYLTGIEFRNRVQAIIESFVTMKGDLDSEKRAMAKIWAQREKQIEKITLNIAGMHGDLEGIVGASLPAVKILELSANNEDGKV